MMHWLSTRLARHVSIAMGLAFAMISMAVSAQVSWSDDTREIEIARPNEKLKLRVDSPPADKIAKQPWLLLNFSTDRNTSLSSDIYSKPAKMFLEAGHRVASFDLPAHGDRIDARGDQISGMRARFIDGDDPFQLFIEDGKSAIDELIRQNLANANRIVVCGVSRAGYCALRLAAAEPRIAGVAALAPVTDWRVLREFAEVRERKDVADLALAHFAEGLAGRPVYMAIGNRDQRVGTDSCTRFALKLFEAEELKAVSKSRVKYLVVDDSEGHALNLAWRDLGGEFLLKITQTEKP